MVAPMSTHPPFKTRVHIAATSFCKSPGLVDRVRTLFPNCRINTECRRLVGRELVEFLDGAEAAIIGTEALSEDVIAQLPGLRFVAKYGVGLDSLDLEAMQRRGIELGWTGGVNRRAVAELVLGMMLGLARNIFRTGHDLKAGSWNKSGGEQLSGKVVGIIGCGHVGTELLRILQPFGCRLLIHDILDKSLVCGAWGAEQVSLDTLLKESDFVSLHVPLTPATRNLVDSSFLAKMKSTAVLINTSRGAVVDQNALKSALSGGVIAGAGVDVFAVEPCEDRDLIQLENFWGTPHIGGNANEAVMAMGEAAIEHVMRWAASSVQRSPAESN
jgi:D-3-phosphoglycerate dehydrogenase